jgi:hypothetical protein
MAAADPPFPTLPDGEPDRQPRKERTMPRKPLAVLVALGLVLLLGACGGGSGKPSQASPTSGPGAPSPTTAGRPQSPTSAVNPNAPEASPAGDIPDNQVFVRYHPPGAAFSVKVPEGWGRISQGGTVTFSDKLNSVRMQTTPAPSAPTVASARQAELPAIRAASTRLETGAVSQVRRSAGSAVRITYKADAPPDPVTGKVVHDAVERYEFWRGGTEAILTLSGPVGADNVDPWRIVTDSFRWR